MWHWRPPNKNYNQSVKIFGAKLHMLYFEKYPAAGHIEIFTLRRPNCCFFCFFLISKVCRSKCFLFFNQILFLSSTTNIPINFSNTSFFVYFLIFARGWVSSSASMSISWGIFPSHFLGLNFKQTDDNSFFDWFIFQCCMREYWNLLSLYLASLRWQLLPDDYIFIFFEDGKKFLLQCRVFKRFFFKKTVWIKKKGKSLET